jgi:hypothetical protein
MQPTTAIARPIRPAVLPGGVASAGSRNRTFAFRAPTGELEMRISEMPSRPTPAAVTMLLSAALTEVGGAEATPERTARLCVADRQYLLRSLLIEMGGDELWVSAACAGCGKPFDARVALSQLPVQDAVEYPETSVPASAGRLRVRAPDGADQAAISALDRGEAAAALAARLVLGVENGPSLEHWNGVLSAADLAAMDERMEMVFPSVATRVQAACPDCGQMGTLDVSPLRLLRRTATSVYADVDVLARHYHWPEAEILGLPCRRRARYVRFLDRARGFTG